VQAHARPLVWKPGVGGPFNQEGPPLRQPIVLPLQAS
jgi:hypothetical protein